ncbi:hypothetical protein [Cohnella cellulosilytica]|uniref:Uncharacterized protein n=1 Tax=Cohnella cellulosilytica TaxID=986710 RepID=A0ABW2FAK5_9BACL
MEQLVTFLTSNFQFVIVIVGILYFLFFRKSPLEKRPPNRMPDFGGEAQHRRPERPGRPLPQSQPQQQTARTRPVAVPQPERSAYSAAERGVFATPDAGGMEELESPIFQEPTMKRAGALNGGRETRTALQQRDLAKAVLWSEILGRPRAHKPYRR